MKLVWTVRQIQCKWKSYKRPNSAALSGRLHRVTILTIYIVSLVFWCFVTSAYRFQQMYVVSLRQLPYARLCPVPPSITLIPSNSTVTVTLSLLIFAVIKNSLPAAVYCIFFFTGNPNNMRTFGTFVMLAVRPHICVLPRDRWHSLKEIDAFIILLLIYVKLICGSRKEPVTLSQCASKNVKGLL